MTATKLLFAAFDRSYRVSYLSEGWSKLVPEIVSHPVIALDNLFESEAYPEAYARLERAIKRGDDTLTLRTQLADLPDAMLQFNLVYQLYKGRKIFTEGLLRVDPYSGIVGDVLLTDAFHSTIKQVCRRIGVSVALYNPVSGTFQFLNDRYSDWVAQPIGAIVPKEEVSQTIHPNDRVIFFNTLDHIQEWEAKTLQIRTMDFEGNLQTLMVDVRSFYKPHHTSERLTLLAMQNISAFARQQTFIAEQQSTAERKAREKMEYFSFLNHEMRNHLNVIQGVAKILEHQTTMGQQDRYIRSLSFSAQSMINLVNDVLDYARISAGKVDLATSTFNLRELVQKTCEVFQQQAEERSLSFHVSIDDNLPDCMRGDPLRINQILTNLLSNAIKFTNKGGIKVVVDLRQEEKGIYTTRFIVEDSGIGIPEAHLEDIFTAFRQLPDSRVKTHGSGLGLSIVEGLVSLLGGHIEVQSIVNRHTRFSIELPLHRAISKLTEEDNWYELDAEILSDFQLLYVEDQVSNQLIAEGYCEPWGVRLDVATTGSTAIQLIRQKPYDAILLDMHLPDMDGVAFSKAIRQMEAEQKIIGLPIIALSGAYENGQVTSLKKNAVHHHLMKPVDPQELKKVLLQYATSQQEGSAKKPVISSSNDKSFMTEELHPIDFTFLETTFQDQPERLKKLIKLMLEEFASSRKLMVAALAQKRTQDFRDVKHKLLPSLNYLQMDSMRDLLEEIKESLLTDEVEFDFQLYRDQLDFFYLSIQEGLQHKLAEITAG